MSRSGCLWAGRVSLLLTFIAAPALLTDRPAYAAEADAWQPIGLSGGGSMFTPAISPCDGRLMMLNCDMSGAYMSDDGGTSWRMIHHSQLRGNTRCRPAFHPTDVNTVFAAGGWSGRLAVSHDRGRHWETIGNLPSRLRGEIAIDPGRPARMLAGTDREIFRSLDGGKTWQGCTGPTGVTVGFHFDQTGSDEGRVCFAATADGIWRSDDGGGTWAEKTARLPPAERGQPRVNSFCGGSNAQNTTAMLYCSVPARAEGGSYVGGVFRSADRGETWTSAMTGGINAETRAADPWAMGSVAQYPHVLTTNVRPRTVYALNTNTGVKPPHHTAVYRSDDGGQIWRATYFPDPRFRPACNVAQDYIDVGVKQHYQKRPFGAAIDPSDPDHLMHVDSMACHITDDGGKTWTNGHTTLAPAEDLTSRRPRWLCNGLVVTTTWHYYIDPFEANRHYIAYTDIGFARSSDAGASWTWWPMETQPPWTNTCYEIAFDPKRPGRAWGAFSNVHDIPNGNIILGRHRDRGPGGVAVSDDFGARWRASNAGLPVAPVTSIVLDPKSPLDRRTLYAGVFDHGVFISTDDGRNWVKAGDGVGSPQNRRVCRLHLHPDGTLFALVTARLVKGQFQPDGVGLYRSGDGAKHWQHVNISRPLLWPKDFTVAPADSRVIYLGAADAGGRKEGGLYRTADGGTTWSRLARKGPEHFGAYLHPKRRGWVYMTLTEGAPDAGLWLSKDDGQTWKPVDGLPFANIQRVTFDPADESVIYVTTFGGSVWRGPADRLTSQPKDGRTTTPESRPDELSMIPRTFARVHRTSFEEVKQKDAHRLDWDFPHWFEFAAMHREDGGKGDGNSGARMWVEAKRAHSGKQSIGLALFDIERSRRCEFVVYPGGLVGREYFASYWLYLPADWGLFEPNIDWDWYEIGNPYSTSGAPYSAIHIKRPDEKQETFEVGLGGRRESGKGYSVGFKRIRLPKGEWFHVVTYVRRDRNDGAVRLWLNGQLLAAGEGFPTMHSTRDRHTMSIAKIYHERGDKTPHRLWIDDFELYTRGGQ